jgi:hypothetical protein
MHFVHSLVRTKKSGRTGWFAPIELGESAPHYISFVIPVDERSGVFNEYTCETIRTGARDDEKRDSHRLLKKGEDSFLLALNRHEIWFNLRPQSKQEQRLPYVGELTHADFSLRFMEIEPEEPRILDQLGGAEGILIIGCDPFTHYRGIKKPEKDS